MYQGAVHLATGVSGVGPGEAGGGQVETGAVVYVLCPSSGAGHSWWTVGRGVQGH